MGCRCTPNGGSHAGPHSEVAAGRAGRPATIAIHRIVSTKGRGMVATVTIKAYIYIYIYIYIYAPA